MKKIIISLLLFTMICGCNDSSSSNTEIVEREKSSLHVDKASQNENENKTAKKQLVDSGEEKIQVK